MIKKAIVLFLLLLCIVSCYVPQRDCKSFKNGKFTFTTTINGDEVTTTFIRKDGIEIDFFAGKIDTSSVRWINDCEYIVKNLNPKNKSEGKAIHMKILSTSDASYTFEYGIVGDSKKSKGTAIKTN